MTGDDSRLWGVKEQLMDQASITSTTNLMFDGEAAVGHLLVVDDNEMNRDLLSRRLKRQGHIMMTLRCSLLGRNQ